jgi:DNA-binding transcriptional ArsR family regulator
MRPLVHPSIDDVSVEGVLHALSDPVRVAIFADIAQAQSTRTCSTFLELRDRTVPKSTLSQHFKALREAGLIMSERRGVEMHNTSRCPEIEAKFPGLLPAILQAHRIQSTGQRAGKRGKRRK